MREEYLKAFSEVEQIIKLMPETLQKKIPDRFKNIISTEKSQTYIPHIEEPFEECNIMEETKIILAVIYRDFLCSKQEKKEIKLKDSQKLLEYEKELREKYNTDKLFKNKKESDVEYESKNETSMIIVQEEKWYKKIFNIIKNLFKRNS